MQQTPNPATVRQLRSFCRGEMSAAEAYTTALLHVDLAPFSALLRSGRASHAERARLLRERIQSLGGQAPESSGAWGVVADVIEEAAADLGVLPAIRALEEGEDHGIRDYYADASALDPETRAFIQQRIWPAQLETRRNIAAIRQMLS